MPVFFVLFIVFGIGLVALVGFLGYLAAKKRREELSALAAQRGWTYTARDDSWAERFDGAPFGLGHNRQAANILQGSYDGRGFVAFDFVYHTTETSSGPNGTSSSREETRVGTFPSNVVAGWFGFTKHAFFELSDQAARTVPQVSLG